jgi:hypothetical protein
MIKSKETRIENIAKAIVDFVERTGGPVTLGRIESEIVGFKADGDTTYSYEYVIGDDHDETLIWDGMTEEGLAALRKVLLERRVAMQPATRLIYFLECGCPNHQNWLPISLIPAGMAKVDTGEVLISGSQQVVDLAQDHAREKRVVGFRILLPAT